MKITRAVIAATLLATALAQNKLPTDTGMYYQNGATFTPMKTVCNNGMKAMGCGVRGKFVYNNPSASTQVNDHPTFVFIGADTQHPNVRQQFALIAMNAKKKNREVEFAAGGVTSR